MAGVWPSPAQGPAWVSRARPTARSSGGLRLILPRPRELWDSGQGR